MTKREMFVHMAESYIKSKLNSYEGRNCCIKAYYSDCYECDADCDHHKRIYWNNKLKEMIAEYDNAE